MIQESFLVQPLAPFRLDLTVWALRRRATNRIDRWDGTHYTRVLVVDSVPVKVSISQQRADDHPELLITMLSSAPVESARVKEALQRMFGFRVDLTGFYTLAHKDTMLAPLAQKFLGVKPPRFPSLFEALLNAFACQQVSLDVGIVLLNRLTETYGVKFEQGPAVFAAFPEPATIASASAEDIRALGFSHQKARAMIELATALVEQRRDFSLLEEMGNEAACVSLSSMRGVGRWTAEYVLLRGIGRIDTFPGDDVGAQRNLQQLLHLEQKPTYEHIQAIILPWRPYAGFVYFHLLLEKLSQQGVLTGY
jgi:DNA-3-methyladenine glycosylase II